MLNELIAGFVVGLMSALMDTIQFHKSSWLFAFVKKHFGDKAFLWLRSDWNIYWNKWTHWIFGDGWHSAKNIMWLGIFFSIWEGGSCTATIYFFFSWAISFNIFFLIFDIRRPYNE